ncbi:hypothetical protein CI109_105902 [Kwoniella shandongensis]|uniref:Hexosyltransferase n=1 Tax=Kwoniella shandongensis TaxID=1734106 RepID=A0A5M6BQ51_9TREE|nr:uncharacterized protein CI109_006668 [Kwoniella shandongensis]KAA5525028.1 hypothetical protein CI109_006668 [Kwoniella shandongensis]
MLGNVKNIRLPLAALRRRLVQNPKTSILSFVVLLIAILYFALWRVEHGDFGRWYWNYGIVLHPAMIHIMPYGNWGPVEGPPRWIQEIHDAPWMGHWRIPELSEPVYNRSLSSITPPRHPHDQRGLISPSLIKIHIFSTVKPKAQEKRHLIRRLSPIFQIPPAYRHLIEVKFVVGHAYKEDWSVDEEMEASLTEEQEMYGDMFRLNLYHGENLREGKILDWIRAVGDGEDGGRDSWWLFKVDDDSVLNLPTFLDTLITLDPHIPHYLGTSLNRWPPYQHHFTGMVTGFSWGVVKTMAAGIAKMPRGDIEWSYDDDVLTGEIMFDLPSGPQCRRQSSHDSSNVELLPDYCDPHRPPPWGWTSSPLSPDPRTDLVRYDFVRRMGDKDVWFVKGDVARHSWFFKFPEGWEKEWKKNIKGKMWKPPKWFERFADPAIGA